jgi:O-antigen/teichoic acid export membrane protein
MLSATKDALSVIRLRAFDTSTPEGRSKERYRRAALTTLMSFAFKGVNVATLLLTVPLTLRYLGADRFGLWMTISSLSGIFCFADLGMSASLKTLVAEADGRGDIDEARRLISSSYAALSVVALILLLTLGLAYPLFDWGDLYNVHDAETVRESGAATAAVAACFLLNIPVGLINQIQAGYQQGFVNALWQGLGSLLGLIGVAWSVWANAGLVWLVLAASGGPLIACAANTWAFFRLNHPELSPTWARASWSRMKLVGRTGLLYLILAVAMSLTYFSDNLVLAHARGPEAVAEYSIACRLFGAVSLVCGFLFNPLWPAYTEALARGEVAWVRQTVYGTLGVGMLVSGVLSIVVMLGQAPLVHWWIGSEVQLSLGLVTGMACWTVLSALGGAVAMFLNGAEVVRYQVVSALFLAGSAVAAKVYLSASLGSPGIVWGNVLSYTACVIVPQAVFLPILFKRLAGRCDWSAFQPGRVQG